MHLKDKSVTSKHNKPHFSQFTLHFSQYENILVALIFPVSGFFCFAHALHFCLMCDLNRKCLASSLGMGGWNILGYCTTISPNPCHVLRHYFREREHTGHNLRPRAHNFALPIKDDRNFISSVLYGVIN